MIADLPAVAPLIAPAPMDEVERRRRHRDGTRYAIGAIIILSDGSECVVSGYDRQGRPLCYPNE